MSTCKYDNCDWECDDTTGDGFCILHSPKPEKDQETFKEALMAHREKKGDQFVGYVFPASFAFDKTKFNGNANFYRAKFKGDIDFSGTVFSANAVFINAEFSGLANFFSVEFSGFTGFLYAKFGGKAYFRDAKFRGFAAFAYGRFGGHAYFKDAKFGENGYFRDAKFGGIANFNRVQFAQEADFIGTRFTWAAHFSDAEFGKVQFGRGAYLKGAKFYRDVRFLDTNFNGDVHLGRAEFSGKTHFSGADFIESADFSLTEFRGDAFFEGTQFSKNVVFSRAKFFGRTLFDYRKEDGKPIRIFPGPDTGAECDFTNAIIERPDATIFRDADVRKCRFQGTDLRKPEFVGVTWPEIIRKEWPKIGRRFGVYDEIHAEQESDLDTYPHIEQLYRQLKQNCEDRKDYERARDFHYGEKEMRRKNPKTSRGLKCLLFIYKWVSGYGERALRPLVWMAGLLVVSTFCYLNWGLLRLKDLRADLAVTDFWDVGLYSLQVMALLRPNYFEPVGFCAGIIYTAQSILGPLLIGLFALAIRQRLKR